MAEQNSWSTLNTTKLFIPPVPEDFVARKRLDDRLDFILKRPLALVSAPPGYGKSTAVAAWLQTCNLHRAWFALDETDNEPAVFMMYFLAAIRYAVPTFGVELGANLEAGRVLAIPAFVDFIFAELNRVDQAVVLVIEDCHLIRAVEVLEILRELMRHPHPLLHLVLITRHDLPLPLSEWGARNQMLEIRAANLRFNLEETTQFLGHSLGNSLDPEMMARLYQNTEGWVAGLRLALLSLTQAQDIGDQVFELSAHNRHIIEYLADQVLDRLPAGQQAFLIQTSILERLSGPLCEAVVAADGETIEDQAIDDHAFLTELYRQNLFTIPLDAEMSWFRYHHLLSDFLRGRLIGRYSQEAIAGLHLRAGHWLAAAGYTEDAIRHLIAGGAMEEAVDLVAEKRHDLFNREQWARLMIWYNLFPEQVVEHTPDLLLVKAWFAHTSRFDIEEVGTLSERVERLLQSSNLDPARIAQLRAENDILRGVHHYYQLESSACLELCQRSLATLPLSRYVARSFARIYSSGALHLKGKMASAFDETRLGRREDVSFPDYPRSRNAAAEGYLCWMAGDLHGVEQAGTLALVTASTGGQYNSLSWGHYFTASAHYHWNNLERAEYHAQQIFDNRYVNHAIANIFAGYMLSLVHQAAGRPEKARGILSRTAEFATEIRSQPMQFLAQAFQVELGILQGHTDNAALWAKRLLPTMQMRAMPFFYAPQLSIAKALLAAGDPADLDLLGEYLRKLVSHVETIHNNRFLIEALAIEAMFLDACGDEGAALAALNRSLALAERADFIRLYVDLGPRLKGLLQRVRKQNSPTNYIERIMAAFPGEKPTANEQMVEPLTERELQVLNLLAKRYSNKEIAQELFIAAVTVKRHTVNIYQKLSVGSRREAVIVAQQLRIID